MRQKVRTRWLWVLLTVPGCAEDGAQSQERGYAPDGSETTGAQIVDAAVEPSDAEPVTADTGSEQQASVPSIKLERQGALGFCIDDGMVLEAAITPASELQPAMLRNRYCPEDGCFGETQFVERDLTTEEVAQLASLVDALPEGECFAHVNPVCDPCLIQELTIADHVYRIDPCSAEPCPGFNAAAARLVTFIDRIAAAEPKLDPADCFSPQQNPEQGLEAAALGCSCDWAGQGVCISGHALICGARHRGDVPRWYGVIDGPCWQTCEPEEAELSLTQCLQSAVICVGPAAGPVCSVVY